MPPFAFQSVTAAFTAAIDVCKLYETTPDGAISPSLTGVLAVEPPSPTGTAAAAAMTATATDISTRFRILPPSHAGQEPPPIIRQDAAAVTGKARRRREGGLSSGRGAAPR